MVISKDDIEAMVRNQRAERILGGSMKIEVGKTYEVNAYFKKSLFEIEQFKHEDGRMSNTEIMWRNGTHSKVCNQDEADSLQECLGEDGEIWDYEDYEEIEMDSCFDGCPRRFCTLWQSSFTEAEQEALAEEYEEQLDSDEWMGLL